ncbi:hypothetical protein D9K80_15665 [Acinetobacter cumulans]|uniref:Phage tail protein n=1 Tax=Acinetobacter cumulans TaxID=2136182 RepID=A0A498CWW6_9GAMM|nr:hypothetical protein [Acinetobacter cumulans]RLL30742.1 hypothetical protein D9K80_15665 [Acinetobacter cumulans]
MIISTEKFGDVILLTTPMLIDVTETLAFKTDVFEAKNGTEQRTPLKDKARQTLSFSSIALHDEVSQNFNVQWGGIRKLWAVPLAQESQYVDAVDGDFIDCRTDIFSFYVGGLALLKSDAIFQLVEVVEVQTDGLLISESATMAKAKLYPVRVCFISGDISRQVNSFYARSNVTFVVLDEPEVQESVPVQFLGNDLDEFCLMLNSGSLETTISQNQVIIDSEIGQIYQSTDWNHARYGKQYRTVLKGPEQLYAYRQFLFRRQGRFRPFWLPSYERNMRCKSTGLISSVMLIEHDQYKQLADQRKHIAIKSDGNWTAHTITASAPVAGNSIQITITPALNKNASAIERISYLGLHRLDADSIDIHYQGAGIVEVSVPILEIGV